MKTTVGGIEAAVGPIGGHVAPSRELDEAVGRHAGGRGLDELLAAR